MTKPAEGEGEPGAQRRCGWCRRVLPAAKATGRPRRYCSASCRQWDWVTRRGSREVRLTEEELVVARTQVDTLHDQIYVLHCAIEDTERDLEALGDDASAPELRAILNWLVDNARPLADQRLRPTPS